MKTKDIPGFTKGDLAKIAGYTYRRLYDIDRNLPDGKRLFVENAAGKCDLSLFVQRWVDYNVSLAHEADGKSLDEVRAIHEAVKTRKTELEVARMEGALVDAEDVRRLWAVIAANIQQNMLRMPAKLAPRLRMVDNIPEIAGIIEEEILSVLTGIADTPLPEYTKEAGAEDDDDER